MKSARQHGRNRGSIVSGESPNRFVLRPATNQDADEIWRLISTVLLHFGILANRQTTDRDLTDIESHYDGHGGAFFVLLDAQTVIGTVALRPAAGRTCELCRMYLAEAYRGQGLGRLLFDHVMAESRRRGFSEIFLKTASVLTAAISLYERAGFRHVPDPKVGGNCDRVMRMKLN
jgi:putative acetyltransferase